MYVLGLLNTVSHDPSACLISATYNDTELVDVEYVHFEESMLTRRKTANLFPVLSVDKCLDYFGISINDLDCVATDYMENQSWFNSTPKNRKQFSDYIKLNLNNITSKVEIVCSHHMAHAFSAVWPTGFPTANVLVMDGSGSEYETGSIYHFDGENFTKIAQQKGTGIGLLYTLVTKKLGFKTGEEGKTMGLAPFGIAKVITQENIFEGIDGDYFTDYTNILNRFPSHSLKLDITQRTDQESVMSDKWIGLAFDVQAELERTLIRTMERMNKDETSPNFCYAGGLALNCSLNSKIYESGYFNNIFIQPNCGDAGVTLGLAIAGLQKLLVQKSIATANLWRLGPKKFKKYSDRVWENKEITTLLEKLTIPFTPRDDDVLVEKILQNKVVAYFEGGWEFGPRALGHRSFLASPRDAGMKDIMNKKIKHREPYRPFAPILLEEDFEKYFYGSSDSCEFMLTTVKTRDVASLEIPAVVHVDNTARVQVLKLGDGKISMLLKKYQTRTGNSVLINTSFNDNNEPIVYNPEDAISCFLRTNADILVLEDVIVFRENISDIPKTLQSVAFDSMKAVKHAYKKSFQKNFNFKSTDEDPSAYISRKLLVSLYFRYAHSFEKLESLSTATNKRITFITDDYHSNILKKNKFLNQEAKLIVFKDDLTALDSVKRALANIEEEIVVVLLYNLSPHLQVLSSSNITVFYEEMDCLISYELAGDHVNNDPIQDFEFNGNINFNDYLKNGMFRDFSERYLVTAQINEMNSRIFLSKP